MGGKRPSEEDIKRLKFGCSFDVLSPIAGLVEIRAVSQKVLDEVVLKVIGGAYQVNNKQHKVTVLKETQELDVDSIAWSW